MVVIPTKNEVSNIGACIAAVIDRVESVYVVDSGSSDGTRDEAATAGATVLERRQSGAFDHVDQKNWALKNVASSTGWVLFLDADERATDKFLGEVDVFLRDQSSRFDAAYAAPKFMYQGTWLRRFMGFPNWHPRLVNSASARLEGRVWESFSNGSVVGYISEPYLHFANSKGLTDWLERHSRYAEEEARLSELGRPDGRARRGWERWLVNRAGSARPILVLLYHLVWRRGFFDGGSVWSYARRQLIYQLMIAEAKRERIRARRDLPR